MVFLSYFSPNVFAIITIFVVVDRWDLNGLMMVCGHCGLTVVSVSRILAGRHCVPTAIGFGSHAAEFFVAKFFRTGYGYNDVVHGQILVSCIITKECTGVFFLFSLRCKFCNRNLKGSVNLVVA